MIVAFRSAKVAAFAERKATNREVVFRPIPRLALLVKKQGTGAYTGTNSRFDFIHLLLRLPDIAAPRGINPNTLWQERPVDTVKLPIIRSWFATMRILCSGPLFLATKDIFC
jgi:hypothetical protein